MSKCLFGWIFNIYNLALSPATFCNLMSERSGEKCFILAALVILGELIMKCARFCCPCCFEKKQEKLIKTSDSVDLEQGEELIYDESIDTSHILKEPDVVKDVFVFCKNDKLQIDCRVRFLDVKSLYQGGTVKWTGYKNSNVYYKLVVVRLDDGQQPGSTDGEFEGQRLVKAEYGVHYLMMAESQALPINLQLGDYCLVNANPKRLCTPKSQGFVRCIEDSTVTLIPYDMDYSMNPNMQNHSKFKFHDYLLTKAPPPVSDERSDAAPPISADQLDRFCGRNKGIQGRCNSCYLDTLLFSLFTFSDVLLDDLADKERNGNVSDAFYTAFNCLRYQIVYPLRASHFVSDEHVDFLRRFIAKETGKEQFEGETRDIPECMDALFGKILSWTPELAIGSIGASGGAHFNQSFVVEIVSSEGVGIPTTQNLLEKASLNLEFCFREVPNFMFVQLPREAGQSSIVIPSLQLDLKNMLYQSVKECSSCGRNATLQFPELAQAGGLAKSYLCQGCAAQRGLDEAAARHLPEPAVPDGEEPDSSLVLTAVLCIELSHYNCFARCGDRWVFFDSMSDQEELFDHLQSAGDASSNKLKKFNIPCVQPVPEFRQWIDQSLEEFNKDHLKSFLEPVPEKEQLNRLFSYAYMCLYTMNTS